MKTDSLLRLGALVVCGVALNSWAADPVKEPGDHYPTRVKDHPVTDTNSYSHRSTVGHVVKASDLLGHEVTNAEDEKLGKIDELAVDVEAGRIVEVVLSTGLFGRSVVVPPSAFRCDPDPKDAKQPQVRLPVTKASLKDAPEFSRSRWEENFESNRLTQAYRHYNATPYFVPSADRALPSEKFEKRADSLATNDYRGTNPKYWSRLGRVDRASKVIGMTVRNRQDESIGRVDDMLVDLNEGSIRQVLVSTGGFLGLGDVINPIPPAAFRVDSARNGLMLDADKNHLKNAPRFPVRDWQNPTNRTWDREIYRYYGVQPHFADATGERSAAGYSTYSTNSAAYSADNTGRNKADRDSAALDPLDQGTSEADRETTRNIRKAIRDENGLSVNAQNIKVITREGRVTLRGPVQSEQEKQLLTRIAERVATAENVDSQLEVK